ncbi:MAG TPA: glycoside hydrolase family 30 beta sandwich domain-containing protein [Steroidobacteraceae bacterium]|nr:glycoside hydrolase family 30 beta sandwich domain-containing protein [Steroidobacteraceae bacterium]
MVVLLLAVLAALSLAGAASPAHAAPPPSRRVKTARRSKKREKGRAAPGKTHADEPSGDARRAKPEQPKERTHASKPSAEGKRAHSPQPGSQPKASPTHVSIPVTSPVAVTQTSSDLTQALSPQPGLRFSPSGQLPAAPVIHVDDGVRYQTFSGVGAAMTDSSAWLIGDELPSATADALMGDLFGAAGAHLGFLRVPMGASDYSATGVPYTYDDQPAGESDPTLSDFSIAHDTTYILPALREAMALNPSLYLEAVPWSPPAWMKANDALENIDHAGTLLPSSYGPLAQYFVKFLQAYAARGVPIAAVTPQNEPGVPTQYPGMELDQQQELTFVTHYLRPALQAAGLDPSVFGWDLSWGPLNADDPLVANAAQTAGASSTPDKEAAKHSGSAASLHRTSSRSLHNRSGRLRNRGSSLRDRSGKSSERAGASKHEAMSRSAERQTSNDDLRLMAANASTGAVTGLAWHCYFGNPTYMTGVHNAAPNSLQIVDECATGTGDIFPTSELLISSLRNWASSVALWNLALDPSGEPVQPPDSGCGGCTGVVTVNDQTGTFTLSKDYYQLAQLSHFVQRGAVRIASGNFVSYNLTPAYQTTITPGLDDVAFENPDGSKVLFVYNNSPAPIAFNVEWHGSYVSYAIPAGATTTLSWD